MALTALFVNGFCPELSSLIKKHKLEWQITEMVELVAFCEYLERTPQRLTRLCLPNYNNHRDSEGQKDFPILILIHK